METSKIGKAADTDDTIAAKLTAQIEKLIVQWPDAEHAALRSLLVTWTEALTPPAGATK